MSQFKYNFVFDAQDEHAAKVKIKVIQNLLEKLSDSNFVDTLYPKIKNNPNFFVEISQSPLLKMFK